MSVTKQAGVLVMGSSTAVFFFFFLCFVDRASMYNLVNKASLVQNFS